MTINDANRLVLALVGEDDFHDVKDVLTSYYDLAQVEIATTVAPILKTFEARKGSNRLPDDFYRICHVPTAYSRTDRNHISVDGDVTVKYYAYPTRLKDDADGTTEFEVVSEAQQAIPYYAAARTVLSDSDMRRYYAFMDLYSSVLSSVAQQNTAASVMTVVQLEDTGNV